MTTYPGFQEWLLNEMNEEACGRPSSIGPVKPSTLNLVDEAAAELRFRDKVWRKHRDRLFREWRETKPTQTLAEFVDRVCEEVRRG